MSIPTPHIQANAGEIAKSVLMPGDPLRAKFIADNYLTNAKTFNTIRNMLGYTGLYKGQAVSVIGSGMGVPSMGIYSYELFNFYDVDNIIRVGSAGGFQDYTNLRDVIIAMGASTDSNFAVQYQLTGTYAPIADFELLERAVNIAREKNIATHVGNVLTSDVFYNDGPEYNLQWKKMNILGVEMEAASLYMNAARAGKKALSILTVTDLPLLDQHLSAKEREDSLIDMIELSLNVVCK